MAHSTGFIGKLAPAYAAFQKRIKKNVNTPQHALRSCLTISPREEPDRPPHSSPLLKSTVFPSEPSTALLIAAQPPPKGKEVRRQPSARRLIEQWPCPEGVGFPGPRDPGCAPASRPWAVVDHPFGVWSHGPSMADGGWLRTLVAAVLRWEFFGHRPFSLGVSHREVDASGAGNALSKRVPSAPFRQPLISGEPVRLVRPQT